MKEYANKDIDLIGDICDLHEKFGVIKAVKKMTPEMALKFLELRHTSIQEEVTELKEAIDEKNAEEVVDALIDILVFSLGTLDAFDVHTLRAWKEVHRANMKKKVGVKEGRPNPLGLPDLVKPDGWKAPSHNHNHGNIAKLFKALKK
tara:strand:+ start:784 stop:1224 length:441 start_codon:yes stop_codon:yes gene_type:complete